ncbi:carbohydrate ABC transporter permease [Demequina activiva]|uniref:Sugar ABC transporter permease n=1 Tax=Demequina activiva TaxID=1582364 RepID=A0A919Q5N5_9MICO|nr:sugar ABC transporter permease [Demequina activiva]GIG54723.1 sugar ABC transporter permease [Demequina activiva]
MPAPTAAPPAEVLPPVQSDPPAPRGRPRKSRLPYYLIIPAIVVVLVGTGYPLVWQFVTSFREYGLAQQFGTPAPFVGFQNYVEMLTDSGFWVIVLRSVIFCVVTATVSMGLGILLAVIMKNVGKGARLSLQIALLLAWAMPIVAYMTVWIWIFDDRNGILNYLLSLLPGVDMIGHNWLVNPLSFFAVGSIIIIWYSVPFIAFSAYAGFTQVSDEVLEAAQLDGASGAAITRRIVLPIIKPVLSIVFLLQLIWDLRVFAQIQLLQDAGSFGQQYDLLGTFIYKLGTGSQDFGLAATAAIVVMLLTLGLSWVYVRQLLKEDDES